MMKRSCLVLAAALVVATLVPCTPATAQQGPMIGEVFLCTFHEGKGWNDLDVAIDVYNDAVARAGIEPINEFIWRPLRARVDFDFIWAAYTPDLGSWARNLSGYIGSAGGGIADAVFESVIECGSLMTLVDNLYDSERVGPASRDPGKPDVLESFLCTLQDGKTRADLEAATAVWRDYVTKLGSPMDVYRRFPFVANDPDVDVSYFAVYPDLVTYAAAVTAYDSNPGVAQVNEALSSVQKCRSSLWTSWQVSPPAD